MRRIDSKKLGAAIRAARLASDSTQVEAAERADIAQANWSGIETGQYTPSLPTLARMAWAVGVSAGSLLDAGCVDGDKGAKKKTAPRSGTPLSRASEA